MTLIVICIVLFVVAAVFGVVNFVTRLTGGSPTRASGYVHGAVATASFVLAVIYSVRHSTAGPDWAFRLFVVAALAGFILFGINLATKKAPMCCASFMARWPWQDSSFCWSSRSLEAGQSRGRWSKRKDRKASNRPGPLWEGCWLAHEIVSDPYYDEPALAALTSVIEKRASDFPLHVRLRQEASLSTGIWVPAEAANQHPGVPKTPKNEFM